MKYAILLASIVQTVLDSEVDTIPTEAIQAPDDVEVGWRFTQLAWRLPNDPPPWTSLEEGKPSQLQQLEVVQDGRRFGGFAFDGRRIQSDTCSRTEIGNFAAAAARRPVEDADEEFVVWMDTESVELPLTVTGVIDLQDTLVQFDIATRDHVRALRQAILDAETTHDLEFIDIYAGWPT